MTRATSRYRCAEPGCGEVAFTDYDTKADQREAARRRAVSPWRCTRHNNASEVLSPDSAVKTTVMTAAKSKRFPELTKLFWLESGKADVGSGFTFGDGYKAWADDFPEGTVLTVTATITLPFEEML